MAFQRRNGTYGPGVNSVGPPNPSPTESGPARSAVGVGAVREPGSVDGLAPRTPSRRAGPLQDARHLVRSHWLLATFLAAGLVLRVLAQFAYRPALFYIDSVKYLYSSDGNDPEGYKLPLRGILLVGNFNAVVAVQHLLGLGIAVVLYILLLRRGVPRWLAALAAAPILLDAYQLQSEQTIMPGPWFEALIVAGIAILLWRPTLSWRRVVAGGLVLGTSATVAQVGEALIPAAALFVLAAGGDWRRAIGKAATLCAACAVPILLYCTGSLLATGGFFLSHSGVTSFYGRTAAAADCATLRLPADERALCPTTAQQARGNDWLEFGKYAPVQAAYYDRLPRGEVNTLVTNFSRSVVVQQPLRVLSAYGRDVLKLFAVDRVTAPGDPPIDRWQFRTSFPYFSSHATPAIVDAATERFGGGRPAVWRPVAAFLSSYQRDGGYTPGPALVLCTVAGLVGSALVLRRRTSGPTRQLALACLLFSATGVSLMLISDLFVFSWRYQLPALVTLVPAGAVGISAINSSIRTRRGIHSAPPLTAVSAEEGQSR
jgi:hypothetical protein